MGILEEIESESKWRIIQALARKDRTPSELARILRTSVANITQHLSKLESTGLVKRVGVERGSVGRPFARYSLGRGFVLLVEAVPGEARKVSLEADQDMVVHLNIWDIPQREYHRYVEEFWWKIQDYMEWIEALAVFGSVARGNARAGSDIDMLILARKNSKRLEERFGAKMVGPRGKGRMVMAKVFSSREFDDMLKAGSAFAKEVVSTMRTIYDPNRVLEVVK